MSEPLFKIPAQRLPPGFAERIGERIIDPAEPQPAATVVLLREAEPGMQVLLMKRHRSSGFVPGAYVFPGGRIDPADGDQRLTDSVSVPSQGAVPAHYWLGALREVFEETGILLARTPDNVYAPDTSTSTAMEQWRRKLMSDEAHLVDVVVAEQLRIVLDDVVYFAHWITPEAEPRRYDTRFFAAALPEGRSVTPDAREIVDVVWLTPSEALARFEKGDLPMVFPTVRTLQDLSAFANVQQALQALRRRDVQPVLPRLVRSGADVGIVIDP